MALVRTLAETGRRIRVERADRRQRLPCKSGWMVGGPDISQFHDLLSEELNVESLTTKMTSSASKESLSNRIESHLVQSAVKICPRF